MQGQHGGWGISRTPGCDKEPALTTIAASNSMIFFNIDDGLLCWAITKVVTSPGRSVVQYMPELRENGYEKQDTPEYAGLLRPALIFSEIRTNVPATVPAVALCW